MKEHKTLGEISVRYIPPTIDGWQWIGNDDSEDARSAALAYSEFLEGATLMVQPFTPEGTEGNTNRIRWAIYRKL